MSDYAAWIAAYVSQQPHGFVRGKCQDAVYEMLKEFPVLRAARGLVHWSITARSIVDQHWWCVTPDGVIIDPTVSQFAHSLTPLRYEELDITKVVDRDKVPIGRCMNCGEPTYRRSISHNICSERCSDELMEEYQ